MKMSFQTKAITSKKLFQFIRKKWNLRDHKSSLNYLRYFINISLIGNITFDGRGIYDFDPNNTSYLSTEIPLELTNDIVLDAADTKSHQFVIGYKKTIKSEDGFLSVI